MIMIRRAKITHPTFPSVSEERRRPASGTGILSSRRGQGPARRTAGSSTPGAGSRTDGGGSRLQTPAVVDAVARPDPQAVRDGDGPAAGGACS